MQDLDLRQLGAGWRRGQAATPVKSAGELQFSENPTPGLETENLPPLPSALDVRQPQAGAVLLAEAGGAEGRAADDQIATQFVRDLHSMMDQRRVTPLPADLATWS